MSESTAQAVSRALSEMERLREEMEEADGEAELAALRKKYNALWLFVRPHVAPKGAR